MRKVSVKSAFLYKNNYLIRASVACSVTAVHFLPEEAKYGFTD